MARLPFAFRSATPISLDDALQRFPSLASDHAAPGTSEKYKLISTADVLRGLTNEGLAIHAVQSTRARDVNRLPFVKHAARLRIPGALSVNGTFCEVVVQNAHDGRAAYRVMAGLYRVVCANGMVAGSDFSGISVRHSGDVVTNVARATFDIVSRFGAVTSQIAAMQGTTLDGLAQETLAASALLARYGEDALRLGFTPRQMLIAHRPEDAGSDLWSVFNRVQENIIRGGSVTHRANAEGRVRQHTMRPVTAIDADTSINRDLWDAAAKLIGKPLPADAIAA